MEEEAVLLQNQLSGLEKKYKRLQKESLATDSLFSQWCAPEQTQGVDSNDKIVQLELDLGYTRDVSACSKYLLIHLIAVWCLYITYENTFRSVFSVRIVKIPRLLTKSKIFPENPNY